ncbi:MAG: hypothetical protein V1846_04640 [Candidatus Komeilibacteria bacterium]
MNYVEFVRTNNGFAQAKLQKAALDIAQLLDNNELLPVNGKDGYTRERQAKLRSQVFDDFCVVCFRVGVAVPDLEPALYEGMIEAPKKEQLEKFTALKRQVFQRLRGQNSRQAKEARALVRAMCVLANYLEDNSFSGAKLDNMLGVLNQRIVGLGLKPVRDDYTTREVRVRLDGSDPGKPTTVVVVDDSSEELIKTALALAGWPNLQVVLYRQRLEGEAYGLRGERKTQELNRAAQEIMAFNPAVILMDMGLAGFEGTELVRQLQSLSNNIQYIANTGGTPDELYSVGALENCEKGRNMAGMRQAMRNLAA